MLPKNKLFCFLFTVVVRKLSTKLEYEDLDLKFDWFDSINQGPKFLWFMV